MIKPQFRPSTWDEDIFRSVVIKNEYKIPTNLKEVLVIDIGAHIGSFTWLCDQLRSPFICSFEVLESNFKVLEQWAKDKPYIEVSNKAVWTTGEKKIKIPRPTEALLSENTGGFSIMQKVEDEVEIDAVSLNDILYALSKVIDNQKERILVKLDCEGSEYPILFTSTLLNMVDYICGEYHESHRLTGTSLKNFLDDKDFRTCFKKSKDKDGNECGLGLFWAEKKTRDKFFQVDFEKENEL